MVTVKRLAEGEIAVVRCIGNQVSEVGPMISPTDQNSAPAGEDLDIWSLLAVIWRRRRVVVAVMAVVMVATVAIVFTMVPRYAAQSKLLIENRETTFTRTRGEQNRFLSDPAAVLSEVEVLRSRDLAEKVAGLAKLDQYDEFNKRSSASLLSRIIGLLGLKKPSTGPGPINERVIEAYYEGLSVFQVGTSRVIEVQFVSRDPALAAKVSNTLVDEFLKTQRAAKSGVNQEATDWLGRQIEGLRGKVSQADRAVEAFRTRAGLLRGGRDATLNQQQLSELNTQLINATAAQTEAHARAKLVRSLLKKPGGLEAAGDVLNSLLIQRLREQQAVLSRRVADLAATLLPRHPRMRAMQAELADLNRRIKQEIKKIAIGLENEATIAAARVEALKQSLTGLKTDAAQGKNAEVELRALEREAKSQRDVYESLLSRYREASARQDLGAQPANARIISRAGISTRPVFPPKASILTLAGIASFLLGIVLAYLVEIASTSRSARAAGTSFPMPRDAVLPGGPLKRVNAVAQDNRAGLIDAVRLPDLPSQPFGPPTGLTAQAEAALPRIAEQLAGMCAARQLRRIVLMPVDGLNLAADVALHLTRRLGAQGQATILIEAEPNAGALGELLGAAEAPGLAELLAGQVPMTDVLVKEQNGRVGIISAGAGRLGSRALFATRRLWLVLGAALQEFSLAMILTDGLGADAQEIAVQGDFTLIVARYEALGSEPLAAIITSLKKAGVAAAAVLAVGDDRVELFEAFNAETSAPHAA